MGVIYVNGGYKGVSTKIDITQDKRIERLESKLDGSDGTVDNSSALTAMIKDNTEKIDTNIEDINQLEHSVKTINDKIHNLDNLEWIDVIN